jgi:hypothetical protein
MLRRLGRYLRALLAFGVVSIWLAVIALWIRSYWRSDEASLESHQRLPNADPFHERELTRDWLVYSGKGGVCLALRSREMVRAYFPPPSGPRWRSSPSPSYPAPWTQSVTRVAVFTRPFAPVPSSSVAEPVREPAFDTLGGATFSLSGLPATQPGSFATARSPLTLSTVPPAPPSSTGVGDSVGEGTVTFGSASVSVGGNGGPVRFGTRVTGIGRVISPALAPPATWPPPGFRFFAYRAGQTTDTLGEARVIVFPFWVPTIVGGLPMLVVLRVESNARRRRWRARSGMCVQGGYDLRATPDRCPECGAVPAAGAQSARVG